MKVISRLKRAAVLVGVGALMVGGAMLGATSAHAAVGTDLGAISLTPATGSTTASGVTYQTTEACPTGFQAAGVPRLVDPGTNLFWNIAGANTTVTAAFHGTIPLADDFSNAEGTYADMAGATVELVVTCFAGPGPTGASENVMDTYVQLSADGTTYTETNTPPAQPPTSVTVALTANPNPATVGQAVTLTATVTPSSATGTVQFVDNGTNINTTPATIAGGIATTSFTPSAANPTGEALTAVYTPTGNFTAAGPGTLSLPINAAPPNSGNIPLAVVVPQSGTFTVTVPTTSWVVLGVNAAGTSATAPTGAIVVTDTRNYYPGWSVSGQSTQFSGTIPSTPTGFPAYSSVPADHGTQHIAADQLGWAPTNVGTLPQGVALGSAITAGTATNGLGDAAQVLASVHAGSGNGFTGTTGVTLGANLTLAIPAGTEAGPYAGFLDITSVNALP